MSENPPYLDPREHPTRERVHFPGIPGTFMPGEGTRPRKMVETTAVATVEQPTDEQRAALAAQLTVAMGQPTVTVGEPPAGDDTTQAPAAKPRRRKAKEGQS